MEYFVFGLLAEMQGREVQLYGILRDGNLNRYPEVEVTHESKMPSGGALSNPNDKVLVKKLENEMIEAYGTVLVELKCEAASTAWGCDAPSHARGRALRGSGALQDRRLGLELQPTRTSAGGELVAAALKTNTTLTSLECVQLGRPSNQCKSSLSCQKATT